MYPNIKKILTISLLTLGLANLLTGQPMAAEITSKLGIEARLFPKSPAYEGQEHHDGSAMAEVEMYHGFDSGSSITITPFARVDYADSERTHFDLREFNYLHVADSFEITAGISKVFWGSTEIHLVDIINQTDMVESLKGEDKLGQPMVRTSWSRDWGTVDTFILPYFRERTGPGTDGRLRLPLPVDYGEAEYESSAEQYHIDLALRYAHTLGDVDFGIYHFAGTSREPIYRLNLSNPNAPEFTPYYELIQQTGVDFSYVAGRWLWKGEALYRIDSLYGDFAAAVAGFEYTLVGILESDVDLGLIAEFSRDGRDKRLVPLYQKDIMTGLRFAFNNAASTDLLCGLAYDIDHYSQIYSLEFNHRLGEDWKITITSWLFSHIGDADPAQTLSEDDMIRIELFYYF